jgi:alkyl hydroperoxide reductase subunit AhpC
MTLRLGNEAPNFQQDSTEGVIDFHEWLGDSWGILFSHPADFTPVCTTELGRAASLEEEFARRDVKPIALSVDSVDKHEAWLRDIEETQGYAPNFPLIADEDRSVAELYDMIHPNADATATVRSVFIVDPGKKIRLTLTYPASTGRNFDELLRVIDSLQLTEYQKVATPADWNEGDRVVILPAVSDEQADELFPDGYEVVKPYLRTTEQPRHVERVA